jgi:hypothetical protein
MKRVVQYSSEVSLPVSTARIVACLALVQSVPFFVTLKLQLFRIDSDNLNSVL